MGVFLSSIAYACLCATFHRQRLQICFVEHRQTGKHSYGSNLVNSNKSLERSATSSRRARGREEHATESARAMFDSWRISFVFLPRQNVTIWRPQKLLVPIHCFSHCFPLASFESVNDYLNFSGRFIDSRFFFLPEFCLLRFFLSFFENCKTRQTEFYSSGAVQFFILLSNLCANSQLSKTFSPSHSLWALLCLVLTGTSRSGPFLSGRWNSNSTPNFAPLTERQTLGPEREEERGNLQSFLPLRWYIFERNEIKL